MLSKFTQDHDWSFAEKAKYAAFIEINREIMEKRKAANLWKKFVEMSKFLKTRNFRQCKLYHERLVK